MTEESHKQDPSSEEQRRFESMRWQEQFGLSWKTPLGLFGVGLTTICFTLLLLGLFAHMSGLIDNQYAAIVTFLVFPAGIAFGLILIPVAFFIRRKRWFKDSLSRDHLVIDFADKIHRRAVFLFLVLSVINLTVFSLVVYEAYHFTESDYFCGMVCHQVMAPEYTAYQRSPHARAGCVQCHIGSGAKWYVRAKLSGLRQVMAVIEGDYSRPIPAPVEHLRPARDTCETCHWPEKFHGKMMKQFVSYTNENQQDPIIDEIALHIGGHNPISGRFEGIHWHVSRDVIVEYYSLNDKRTAIGKVRVSKPGGITEEYDIGDSEEQAEEGAHWRIMDCIDCHNRPTHVFDDLQRKIDYGLYTRQINPEIAGIREDAFTVLQTPYPSRPEAGEQLIENLLALQAARNGALFVAENEKQLLASGAFMLEAYLGNVWPRMNVTWGTYRSHNGHAYADEGYGCFRCHDDSHETEFGKTISQDCDLCHDEP